MQGDRVGRGAGLLDTKEVETCLCHGISARLD